MTNITVTMTEAEFEQYMNLVIEAKVDDSLENLAQDASESEELDELRDIIVNGFPESIHGEIRDIVNDAFEGRHYEIMYRARDEARRGHRLEEYYGFEEQCIANFEYELTSAFEFSFCKPSSDPISMIENTYQSFGNKDRAAFFKVLDDLIPYDAVVWQEYIGEWEEKAEELEQTELLREIVWAEIAALGIEEITLEDIDDDDEITLE